MIGLIEARSHGLMSTVLRPRLAGFRVGTLRVTYVDVLIPEVQDAEQQEPEGRRYECCRNLVANTGIGEERHHITYSPHYLINSHNALG